LKINPGETDGGRALGATYFRRKRFEAAQGEFETVLWSHPDDVACLYGLGFALLSQNKPSQALGPLAKAQRLSPADPELLTGILQAHPQLGQRAQVDAARGNYPQALAAYRQAGILRPKSEDCQLDYATELALNSKPSEALKIFAVGVKEFPNSASWWTGLGGCYYLVGKYKEAAGTSCMHHIWLPAIQTFMPCSGWPMTPPGP